jgi:copper(I)-binding protein
VSTVRRRRLAATALAATALLALGACGTGFNAQTNQVYQAGTGANHRGEMDVLNTLLVANDDGSATLSAGIVNNTKDEQRLVSVTATTLDDKPLTVASTKMILSLPADNLTTIGGIADAGGFAVLKDATAGAYVKVTLTFSDAAPVTIEAPVVARTAEYEKVGGAPKTEPTPTPTPTDAEAESTDSE